ncbi:hypothetical protein NUW54_g6755 [Trametes sanguinea]|uniref:Uncharacterized protein n=1 Tax=Trametes sanguinea TaxID=158606 RepID=A0ACC1PT06_9APHY|nr:hypothetical protein NUW54_g6755 [Trametes sanguinea]
MATSAAGGGAAAVDFAVRRSAERKQDQSDGRWGMGEGKNKVKFDRADDSASMLTKLQRSPHIAFAGHDGSWITHVATNPRCLAAYNQDYAAIEQNLLTVDLEAPPVPFQGDFFGEYGPQDFPEQDMDMEDVLPILPGDTDMTTDSQDEPYDPTRASTVPEVPLNVAAVPPANVPGPPTTKTVVVPYPDPSAGSAVQCETSPLTPLMTYDNYQTALGGTPSNPYAPFTSETDWLVARWAKLRGPGSTSFTELVTIPGIVQKLALSYKNSRELNNIIDKLPAGRPPFEREEISIAGDTFEVFLRDILACIRALLGDPEFTPILLLVPERHYTDESKTVQVYFDMNTGKWWWATQVRTDLGASA